MPSAAGGANLSANYVKGVTVGGSLNVDNLRIDLVNHRVYADLTSLGYTTYGTYYVNPATVEHIAHDANALNASGATKLTNVYLWDIMGKAQYDADANLVGYESATAIVGDTHLVQGAAYQLNGLKITNEGLTIFTKAFGLLKLGQDALKGVNDFGTISSVPEPSTCALMGLGLLGVSAVARRRLK